MESDEDGVQLTREEMKLEKMMEKNKKDVEDMRQGYAKVGNKFTELYRGLLEVRTQMKWEEGGTVRSSVGVSKYGARSTAAR